MNCRVLKFATNYKSPAFPAEPNHKKRRWKSFMSDKRLIEAFTFMNVCFTVNSFYDQRLLVIAYTVSSFPALSAVHHTCPYRFGYSFRRLLGTFRQFPGKMRDSTKGTFVTSLFYCLFTVNFKKKKNKARQN